VTGSSSGLTTTAIVIICAVIAGVLLCSGGCVGYGYHRGRKSVKKREEVLSLVSKTNNMMKDEFAELVDASLAISKSAQVHAHPTKKQLAQQEKLQKEIARKEAALSAGDLLVDHVKGRKL